METLTHVRINRRIAQETRELGYTLTPYIEILLRENNQLTREIRKRRFESALEKANDLLRI
ncbi:hypothetical protein NEF87_000199 [Candidatus Lokiarchaeum ossiferum]|uniref:Uncharacterized protein n=1 Tax=Candidatus Lokiarchaeum ossiferum TaxID=2951803 RepID=A0ABY6HK66_9ARCH|nr:hypothetical protein NEF87_000199 [Candidatus Lokiarchaeum sp. B-35]